MRIATFNVDNLDMPPKSDISLDDRIRSCDLSWSGLGQMYCACRKSMDNIYLGAVLARFSHSTS